MTPLVIDCDPGQDDAVALMLALASPELDVLGVTTVAGNVGVERTSANALRIVEFANRPGVPVFSGAERPLRRSWVQAERVPGEHGLQGLDLPPPTDAAQPRHAPQLPVEAAHQSGGLVLLSFGRFT